MSNQQSEKRGCRSCNEVEWHKRTCSLNPAKPDLCSPVLDLERVPERKGLMICCMRTAERCGNQVRAKIPAGTIIVCDKCGQEIERLGGQAWKAA